MPALSTPTKRRRRQGSFADFSGDGKASTKQELAEVKSESGAMVDDFGVTTVKTEGKADEPDVQKVCYGCERLKDSSKCFLSAADLVQWGAPSGRGNWCADCHTCWRACKSDEHSLPFFWQWLQVGLSAVEWQWILLAFMSLRKEDIGRATVKMTHDRVRLLQWLFRVVGISGGELPHRACRVLRRRCCCLVEGLVGGPSGVVLESRWHLRPLGHHGAQHRPRPPEQVSHFPLFSHLETSSQVDRKFLEERFGMKVAPFLLT